MPFNKGDFTQQGVAGDVSALIRLNEKRVMKVVLSSDDESDNCDISGAVYDLLNEEVYPIGAGVSGNIEITENGENINVAPYATATVNVAGGGLPTMELTIVNTLDHYVDIVNIEPMALRTYGVESIGLDVAPGTATYNIVYTVTGTLDNPIYKVYVDYDAIVTASGLVNCTFDNDPTPVLLITDPSESSSATITLSGV